MNGMPWPLGINTATRREAFERIDLFDNRLGRKAGTLRNQAQREWHLRARAAGLRGFYVPDMVVHHVVEAERLQKQYFRRWYLLARHQPRHPVREARRRHGRSRQLAARFLEGPADRRRAALHVPHAGDAREGSARRGCAAIRSPRSSTSCGSGSSRAFSNSDGPSGRPSFPRHASVWAMRSSSFRRADDPSP